MMKAGTAVVGQALLAAALPMVVAYQLAFAMFPSALHEDNAKAAVAVFGFVGAALYLLAMGKSVGQLLRARLQFSLFASGSMFAGILLTPTSSSPVLMSLLALAILGSSPLLPLAIFDLVGARQDEPRTEAMEARWEDMRLKLKIGAVAWNITIAIFIFRTMVDYFDMSPMAQWVGAAFIFNGSIELLPAVIDVVKFVWNGITGPSSVTTASAMGRAWYDDESDGEEAHQASSSYGMFNRDCLELTDIRMVNPSTGLDMEGAFDAAGYMLGEDPSPHDDFM